MPRITIVRIDYMTGRAARRAIVARLVVGAEEPGERVIEPRLVDVDQRHGDARTGTGATIRLTDVGSARFLETLDLPDDVGHARLRKQVGDIPAAFLEDSEDIPRLDGAPGRQREQGRQDAILFGVLGADSLTCDLCGFAVSRITLAEDVVLERQDAVVVRRTAPQHRTRCHQAADVGIDDRLVARAAGLACDTVIRRVDESNELRALAVQQRIGLLRVCARRVMPGLRIPRLHVSPVAGSGNRLGSGRARWAKDVGSPAMAVAATEDDRVRYMHRGRVAGRMAADAAGAFPVSFRLLLLDGRRRVKRIFDVAWLLAFRSRHDRGQQHGEASDGRLSVQHQ